MRRNLAQRSNRVALQLVHISVIVFGVGFGVLSTVMWAQFAMVSMVGGSDFYQQAILFALLSSLPAICGTSFLVLSVRHEVPLLRAFGRAGYAMLLTGLPLFLLGITFGGLTVPWPD